MKKLQIKVPVILPMVPKEKDACVERLIKELEIIDGLEKVHISNEEADGVPQLCFHYDPDIISIDRIQNLAERTGAKITEKYGYLLIEVSGIRHTRHARNIERSLLAIDGVLEASVTAAGLLRLEYVKHEVKFEEINAKLEKENLKVEKSSSDGENDFSTTEKSSEDLKEQEDENHANKDDDHDHKHGGILGKNTELIFA